MPEAGEANFEFDVIETPENVLLERRLAGIGSRFIALVVDGLMLVLIYLGTLLVFAVALCAGVQEPTGFHRDVWTAIFIVAAGAIQWGYFIFFELRSNGRTPGKKRMGIRVVRIDGGAVAFADVLIRNLIRIVDLTFLGPLVMFITKRCQRLGDLAAGTLVVMDAADREDLSAAVPLGASLSRHPAASPVDTDREIPPKKRQALEMYFSRCDRLPVEVRERLQQTLVLPILREAGIEAIPAPTGPRIEWAARVLLAHGPEAVRTRLEQEEAGR